MHPPNIVLDTSTALRNMAYHTDCPLNLQSVSQQQASSSRATILNTERIVRNSFVEQIMRLRLF